MEKDVNVIEMMKEKGARAQADRDIHKGYRKMGRTPSEDQFGCHTLH